MDFQKMVNFIRNLKKLEVHKNNFKLIKHKKMNSIIKIKEISKIIIKNNNKPLNNLYNIKMK